MGNIRTKNVLINKRCDMNYEYLKPKYRSGLRAYLGKKYYTYGRYIQWYLGTEKYTNKLRTECLEHEIFSHETPLYRQLKDVDMWLQYNKVENLKIALRNIDGIEIKPGETFSYWKLIGKPTYSKGYKDGMVLYYGKFKKGAGGGLCQLSNMIYWMALHTPLTVVERHRHSFDVFPDSNRTQPFGSGATCVYNYRDLKIKNETNEVYQIKVFIEDDKLNGVIYSSTPHYFQYKVYEDCHEISHQHWGGYVRHNEIRRKILSLQGNYIEDEFICENNALMMYEPLLQ